MNTTDDVTIEFLADITEKVNRYASILIFLFGVLGNLLNILVLSKKQIRINPCAWLFLVSSIANLFAIISGITTRMLSGWAVDPTTTISWLCKLRTFVMLVSRASGSWLIVLAVVDRWLKSCSDVNRRQRSRIQNAQCATVLVFVVISVLYVHIFYCYEANLKVTPLACYYRNHACLTITDVIVSFMGVVFPIIIMTILGVITVINIRQFYRRIRPSLVGQHGPKDNHPIDDKKIKRKNDRTLLKMLFIQVILLVTFSLPLIIQKVDTFFRPRKSPSEVAIDSLFYNIALLSTYVTNGMPFYIYTLCGGSVFRKALFDLFHKHHENQ